MNKKAVLIFSGGLDSTVLLWEMLQTHDCFVLSINYGQRHRQELIWARQIIQLAYKQFPNGHTTSGAVKEHHVVNLGELKYVLGGSSQTSDSVDVPHGHYADETMRATVVPNRNMIMLAIAAGKAVSEGAGIVAYAAHGGDHAIYPDCREEFVARLSLAMEIADYTPVRIVAPYINSTKADIVKRGSELGAPLDLTYSCYEGEKVHCGKCGTCVERREAFKLAGVKDPTSYRS